MADPVTVTIPVTVTVSNFNPGSRTATFQYSGTGVTQQTDGNWDFHPVTGNVTIYELTPAPSSPWQPMPLTSVQDPPQQWVQYVGWTITVTATDLGVGSSASFRVSVVSPDVTGGTGVTYVDDPTIITVDPPGQF